MDVRSASGRWSWKQWLGILGILVVAAVLVVVAWPTSHRHSHADDIREAKVAGFEWQESEDPFEVIRRDWHNAFRKETWESHRSLNLSEVFDLTPYRSLIHRLNPTHLYVGGCKNVDMLEGLTDLQELDLNDCRALQNVDGLKGLTALQVLRLRDCHVLQNVDGLKGLTALQELYLSGCPDLQNVDGLKGLTALQKLSLNGTNIYGPARRAATPNTSVEFPGEFPGEFPDAKTAPPP